MGDFEYMDSIVRDFDKVYDLDKEKVERALYNIDKALFKAHSANDSADHYQWLKQKEAYGAIPGFASDKIQSYANDCLDVALDEVESAIDKLIELKISLREQKARFI